MTTVQERSPMPQEREPNPARSDPDRPIGYGRVQRKEDPRFIRGKGRYLDDIVLPGMLHGAIPACAIAPPSRRTAAPAAATAQSPTRRSTFS